MKYRKLMSSGILVVITVLMASVIFAGAPGPKHFLPKLAPGWSEMYPAPGFKYDKLEPACSSCPTTDSEYSFFVRKGTVNKVLVFFNGGGACWDIENCLNHPTYTPAVYEAVVSDQFGTWTAEGFVPIDEGIFDFTDCRNPFKDWYVVYLPYCTGDLFWGAQDTAYGPYTIQHRGFVNFMAVLDWMQKNFRCPLQVFVTGSSAGGYGAILNYPYIREAFPLSRVYVLGDAANGVTGEGFTAAADEKWDIQYPDWILPGDIAEYSMEDIYSDIAAEYPFMKFAQYTTSGDATQSWFYYLQCTDPYTGYPIIKEPYVWNPDPAVIGDDLYALYSQLQLSSFALWHNQMLTYAYGTADAAPNYRYYIGEGYDHTIMRSDKFYTENSAEGISFARWTWIMANNPFGFFGGPLQGIWQNVEAQ